MLGLEGYTESLFEMLLKERARSFLFRKMTLIAPSFIGLNSDAYIDKWYKEYKDSFSTINQSEILNLYKYAAYNLLTEKEEKTLPGISRKVKGEAKLKLIFKEVFDEFIKNIRDSAGESKTEPTKFSAKKIFDQLPKVQAPFAPLELKNTHVNKEGNHNTILCSNVVRRMPYYHSYFSAAKPTSGLTGVGEEPRTDFLDNNPFYIEYYISFIKNPNFKQKYRFWSKEQTGKTSYQMVDASARFTDGRVDPAGNVLPGVGLVGATYGYPPHPSVAYPICSPKYERLLNNHRVDKLAYDAHHTFDQEHFPFSDQIFPVYSSLSTIDAPLGPYFVNWTVADLARRYTYVLVDNKHIFKGWTGKCKPNDKHDCVNSYAAKMHTAAREIWRKDGYIKEVKIGARLIMNFGKQNPFDQGIPSLEFSDRVKEWRSFITRPQVPTYAADPVEVAKCEKPEHEDACPKEIYNKYIKGSQSGIWDKTKPCHQWSEPNVPDSAKDPIKQKLYKECLGEFQKCKDAATSKCTADNMKSTGEYTQPAYFLAPLLQVEHTIAIDDSNMKSTRKLYPGGPTEIPGKNPSESDGAEVQKTFSKQGATVSFLNSFYPHVYDNNTGEKGKAPPYEVPQGFEEIRKLPLAELIFKYIPDLNYKMYSDKQFETIFMEYFPDTTQIPLAFTNYSDILDIDNDNSVMKKTIEQKLKEFEEYDELVDDALRKLVEPLI